MEIFLLAIVLGLIPAAVAQSKGHSFFLWWVFGAALWIVALPIALLMPRNVEELDRRRLATGARKRCDQCASIIDVRAKICPHCRSGLTTEPAARVAATGATLTIEYGTVELYQVVGESFRQQTLAELVGAEGEERGRWPVIVVLRPEVGNPHDDQAVTVESEDGALLGYLEREDARRCREDMAALGANRGGGVAALRVNAVVVGGWKDENGAAFYGLALRMTNPPIVS